MTPKTNNILIITWNQYSLFIMIHRLLRNIENFFKIKWNQKDEDLVRSY